jgi:threonine/homoserine/homoserine lactone efflux protein
MRADVLGFTVLAAVLVVTPGPDSMLVLGRAVRHGRRNALGAGAGVVVGLLAWAVASSAGIAAFVVSSGAAYDALRLVGAAYLVWVGVQHVRSSRRAGASASEVHRAGGTSFRAGLVTNLLNPKIALFYVSVLPQFAPTGSSRTWAIIGLAAVHIVLSLLWLAGLAVAGSRAAAGLRPAVQRWLEAVGGCVLVALGVRLAFVRD